MKIILSSLKLVNFKGIRQLSIDFSSATEVFGDNATGKTTIFDAFSWLLFDKDSANKKDFDIKTLDANGKVLHGLDHQVEGTLIIDGRPLTLRKVYSEKWTKKRGSATSEFSGHTTDYFIDGVPAKLKEYKDRIESIIDENLFKLLTNPAFFNEQLSWQERRKTLLSICGDVTDGEVISANTSLQRLPGILNGRSIEDHRKVIAARRSEINKELEKIPVRIDEAERSKPPVDGSEVNVSNDVERLRNAIGLAEAEVSRLQTGGEISVQEIRQREIEAELIDIRSHLQSGALEAVSAQRIEVQRITALMSDQQFFIQTTERRIAENDKVIVRLKDEANRLREEWGTANAAEFIQLYDENCPTCGQQLPAEQVESAHAKALADFNRQKSERLESITKRGKDAMSQAQLLEAENAGMMEQLKQSQSDVRLSESQLNEAKQKLTALQSNIQDVSNHPEYVAKNMELEAIKVKIMGLRNSIIETVRKAQDELQGLRDSLRRKESMLASFNQVRAIDKRIAELKDEERRLAEEYERLEEELYLTEEFIRTKVELLESRINSKFEQARFKLFEEQVNGGVAETCETLYKGVPYGSGLNNAARINVGLDIINTLSYHYGITAPIFIDNRESVTKLISCRSQIVSLIVSAADKELRIETNDDVREAV